MTLFLGFLALLSFLIGLVVVFRREPAAQRSWEETRELVTESYGALRRRELDFSTDDIDDVSLGEFLIDSEVK
ncbi:MAG: hypothetical protein Q4P33_09500 [Flaviflexus sp.]|nr:hypothetical protein [Flaviflexus sp.]